MNMRMKSLKKKKKRNNNNNTKHTFFLIGGGIIMIRVIKLLIAFQLLTGKQMFPYNLVVAYSHLSHLSLYISKDIEFMMLLLGECC